MEEIKYNLDDTIRIDKFLSEYYPDLTRSRIQGLIESDNIWVNDLSIKSSYKLKNNDVILVEIPEAYDLLVEPENIPLSILYEDEDILVVDKPKNMVVHPSYGHESGTLVNAILYHCKDELSGINGVKRPGIVHRIDKDTTGSLIICKNDMAHESIANQISEHSLKRIYKGIVNGNLKQDEGTIDAPIGRNPGDRKKMGVVQGGKNAITHYKVLERFKDYTYAQFRLETGRTHQIRVHMSHINHPLLGDETYGYKKSKFKTNGQCLHAQTIGFIHPRNGKYIEVNAPLPEYFKKILNTLHGGIYE